MGLKPSRVERHIIAAHKPLKFRCVECGARLTRKDNLDRHWREKQGGIQRNHQDQGRGGIKRKNVKEGRGCLKR